MAFDSDKEYVKGNSIPNMDTLSWLQFYKEPKENIKETFADTFFYWVDIDVFSLDRMADETIQDPVLKSITVVGWNHEEGHSSTLVLHSGMSICLSSKCLIGDFPLGYLVPYIQL